VTCGCETRVSARMSGRDQRSRLIVFLLEQLHPRRGVRRACVASDAIYLIHTAVTEKLQKGKDEA
jgi:hypothetical protein